MQCARAAGRAAWRAGDVGAGGGFVQAPRTAQGTGPTAAAVERAASVHRADEGKARRAAAGGSARAGGMDGAQARAAAAAALPRWLPCAHKGLGMATSNKHLRAVVGTAPLLCSPKGLDTKWLGSSGKGPCSWKDSPGPCWPAHNAKVIPRILVMAYAWTAGVKGGGKQARTHTQGRRMRRVATAGGVSFTRGAAASLPEPCLPMGRRWGGGGAGQCPGACWPRAYDGRHSCWIPEEAPSGLGWCLDPTHPHTPTQAHATLPQARLCPHATRPHGPPTPVAAMTSASNSWLVPDALGCGLGACWFSAGGDAGSCWL